jgi:hypothetical protein
VSNVVGIGDNYEAEVMFLVTGFQYIASAVVFNFGFEFRQNWFRNYWFVAIVFVYSFVHFYITLIPGRLSCVFRVNCDSEHIVISAGSWSVIPIQNVFNTTIMPLSFRYGLIIIMMANLVSIITWECLVVNKLRKYITLILDRLDHQSKHKLPLAEVKIEK